MSVVVATVVLMTSDDAWHSTVNQLAAMPDVVAQLRADHAPNSVGYCRTCTTPGRGTHLVAWPCSLANIAADAERQMNGE